MKIGQRVTTPHGDGEVIGKDPFGTKGDYRVIVKHDVYPKEYKAYGKPLYYYRNQITLMGN